MQIEYDDEIPELEDEFVELLVLALLEGRVPSECYYYEGGYLIMVAASA